MATIVTGESGTLKAITLEGQLQEAAILLQLLEATPANNPEQIDRVSVSHDPDANIFTSSFSFPVNQNINELGHINYSAFDYLVNINFSPGIGGTFKSTTLTGYLMEMLIYTQNIERQSTRNPSSRNGAIGNFNSDNTLFTGSLNLPVLISIEIDGSIKYIADEYLIDN